MKTKTLIENKLQEVLIALNSNLEYGNYPFGMSHEEGQIWLQSKASTLQWVLEMIGDEE